MQSSSSSFSMSLSGSDTVEDQPSTSGCSSDMAHSKQQKERRKERVKHYLKQLKAMVPPAMGSRGKMGTLSALQHVVDSMKKIQEGKEKTALEKQDVLEKSLNASLYEGEGQLPKQTLKTKDCLRITLRSRDFTVMNVSSNLNKLLGYPMLSWNGRDLIHFIHKKDVVTVNSNLAYESENVCAPNEREEEKEQDDVRKYFYFRIRHYKSLQSGFSLMKADQYTAFQASVVLKTHDSGPDYTNLNLNMNLNEDEDKCPHKYLILECVPLKSAYGIDNLSLERFTFITRHTLFCSFSYMHHNAIPLLGYLPQDLVGMSIFDFYHSDDLDSLYNTYKQVVSAKGTPIKGAPIRFRARNGSYVYLETEWSSFANPWSRRLEFIIGQHTVIKSPKNSNVFADIVTTPLPEPGESVQKTQQKIRQLLLKPIVEHKSEDIPSSSQDEKTTPPTFSGNYLHLCKIVKMCPNFPQIVSNSDVSLSPSQQLFQDNDTSVAYEQLNYTNNIKKFLLSQPRSYSSKSDSKSDNKSPSSNEESDEVEFQEPEEVPATVDDFEVDISVPKPPSFGSSTKVLLSEQGQREEVASSPAHHNEDITEEPEPLKETLPIPPPPLSMPTIIMPPPPPVMEKEDHPKLIHLTQEALIKHTRLQEKIYVSQATHDRNIMMKHQDMTGVMDMEGVRTQYGAVNSGVGLRKRVTEPPWLQTVHWTPKLALLYTVPRRKKHRILKEDRDALCKLKSSDLVLEQMTALQEEVTSEPKSPVVDEESDYLFPLEESELQKLMESADVSSDQDSSEMSVCSMERSQDDMLSSEVIGLENNKNSESKTEKTGVENYDKNAAESESEKLRDEKAMSCDSGDQESVESPKENIESSSRKSDGEASSVECESDYSKTSDLTPSDQRSNEEACSSIKESDGSMKEVETSSKNSDFSSNDNKSSSESEPENKKVPVSAPYDVFFVPLPVKFCKKNKKSVPWLDETELNSMVEMEYSITSETLQNRLKHDKLRLRDMAQPDLVKQQFDAMVEELNLQKVSSPKLYSRQDSQKQEFQGGPGAVLGPVSPKRLSSHQKHREGRRKSKIDEKLFEGLFITMFNEKEELSSKSDSYPDIEDVSNSLDEID
ncbi:hypothetical protein FSP39_020458 [Pinctada imbricata]|uniref:Uncharacterized protein n=1 Tax=Pinctada imbricata TaxID=66713 RepID=A0AA88YGT4_PINIB|nr:hypothetical protein FSP39_020458 [Pinctada imbricata]